MKKIFIGGCDRSGTTFLAGLLAKYNGVVVGPETQFKRDIKNTNFQKFSSLDLLKDFQDNWRFDEWFKSNECLPCHADLVNAYDYESLLELIVSTFSKNKFGIDAECWVDHTPENFEYFNFYNKHLNDVKYIHIYRDGRAIGASLMNLEWGPNTPEAAAKFWVSKLAYPLAAQVMSPGKVISISYESLVENTDEEMKKIVRFCNIDSLVSNNENIYLPSFTEKQHALVGKKPDVTRLNAWKSRLSNAEIDVFEYYSGGLLEILGYEVSSKNSVSFTYILKDRISEMFLKLVNLNKYKKKRNI